MCGRYSFSASKDKLGAQFKFLDNIGHLIEQFNIAPTQKAYVITDEHPAQLQLFTWGLIPFWAKDRSMGSRMINARSETAMSKPAFREAFKKRRCWVLADSFYEWKKEGEEKQPYFVSAASDSPICFGGLYEPARDDNSVPASCTIITLPASDAMASLHHRMPLMFDDPTAWLESNSFDGHLDDLSWHAVDKTVNNPRNQGSKLIHK